MRCVQLVRDVAAAALGQLLVRDQHLVHEAPGAFAQLELLGGEVGGGGEGGGCRGPWRALGLAGCADCFLGVRASACRGCGSRRARARGRRAQLTVLGRRPRERPGFVDVGGPGAPGAARHQPLRTRPLRLHRRAGTGCPPARSAATAAGSSRSGSGVMESHAWRAPDCRTARWYHATDHKVRITVATLRQPLP